MKRKGELIAAPPGEIFVPAGLKTATSPGPTVESGRPNGHNPHGGVLIVNADDWGRDYENTERTLECIHRGSVSSVSAMVFRGNRL